MTDAPKITNQMSAAARGMAAATGCTILDALRSLLVLTANADDVDKRQRIEALAYLIRTVRIGADR